MAIPDNMSIVHDLFVRQQEKDAQKIWPNLTRQQTVGQFRLRKSWCKPLVDGSALTQHMRRMTTKDRERYLFGEFINEDKDHGPS